MSVQPTFKAIKATALRAALEDRTIRISESLLAEFRFFDPSGAQIYEDAASIALSGAARAG